MLEGFFAFVGRDPVNDWYLVGCAPVFECLELFFVVLVGLVGVGVSAFYFVGSELPTVFVYFLEAEEVGALLADCCFDYVGFAVEPYEFLFGFVFLGVSSACHLCGFMHPLFIPSVWLCQNPQVWQ